MDLDAQIAAARGMACVPLYESVQRFDWESPLVRRVLVFARRAGYTLHPWHVRVLAGALARDPETGRFLHRVVVVLVPRQQGKTLLGAVRLAAALWGGEDSVYTAQSRHQAEELWTEYLRDLWRPAFGSKLAVTTRPGSEAVRHADRGGRVRVLTPDTKAPRGKTLDLGVIDEARFHPLSFASQDLLPTMSTNEGHQMWLLSNAGTPASTLLLHYRDLGRAGAPTVAHFEWAAAEADDAADPDTWRRCMPALDLPNGVSTETIRGFHEITPPAAFDAEYLNRWELDDGSTVIDLALLAKCASRRGPKDRKGVVLAVAADLDLHNAAVVAVSMSGDKLATELVRLQPGPSLWVADYVAELCAKWGCRAVIDGGGPARALGAELAQKGVKVAQVGMADYASGCALLVERVHTEAFLHNGSEDFVNACAVATKRRMGGEHRWAWKRPPQIGSAPPVPITPLEAASVGAFLVLNEAPVPEPISYAFTDEELGLADDEEAD